MAGLPDALLFALQTDLMDVCPVDVMKSGQPPIYSSNPGNRETRVYAAWNLWHTLFKKYEDQTEMADRAAIEKFLTVNNRMALVEVNRNKMDSAICYIFDTMRDILYKALYPSIDCVVNAGSILDGLDVGPGASVGATGQSPYEKLGLGCITTTSEGLYMLYEAWTRNDPKWEGANEIRASMYGDFELVAGSKLSCVPKNRDCSRTICTEPLLNMMFQKGIGRCFEEVLHSRFGIRFSGAGLLQPWKNSELARLGSIDGSYATIDLSSASDSVSLALVRALLPRSVVGWLEATRSPVTNLPDGSSVELHMLSSMGNGYTFPLETLIFASLVLAVYDLLRIEPVYPRGTRIGNFGVFGDDIICVARAAPLVLKALEAFGFQVNSEKTFTDVNGRFRESCGTDFLNGSETRGVYCKRLTTLQDKFSLINGLNSWSEKTGIPLPETVATLLRVLGRKATYVPPWENPDGGIRCPLDLALQRGVRRVTNTSTGAYGFLYQCYRPRPVELHWVWGETFISADFVDLPPNPHAGMLCGLRGNLRNGRLSLRSDDTFYKSHYLVAPGWVDADRVVAGGITQRAQVSHGWLTSVNLVGDEV